MKNRARITEKDVKALLAKLRGSQTEYPPELLSNRRYMFLGRVPQAGIFIANAEIYKRILQGLRSTASLVTRVVLLSIIGLSAAGTTLVATNPGLIRVFEEGLNNIERIIAPATPLETLPSPPPDQKIPTTRSGETPTPMPTFTLVSTLTPSITPLGTQTPTLALGINPTNMPNANPTNTPKFNPTNTPKDNPGHHYGQTPTPPGKRTNTP
jgi:hypothetical protein